MLNDEISEMSETENIVNFPLSLSLARSPQRVDFVK
jgi:hypothetical protein